MSIKLYTDFEIVENDYYKIPIVNNVRFNFHIRIMLYIQYDNITVYQSYHKFLS